MNYKPNKEIYEKAISIEKDEDSIYKYNNQCRLSNMCPICGKKTRSYMTNGKGKEVKGLFRANATAYECLEHGIVYEDIWPGL